MPNLEEWNIDRVYKCHACEAIVQYTEKVSKPFRKKCPLCNKNELLLESGNCGLICTTDMYKAKTLGSLSDENIKRREKESNKQKSIDKPWWRKNKKIDFRVLKNPSKYIETGDL